MLEVRQIESVIVTHWKGFMTAGKTNVSKGRKKQGSYSDVDDQDSDLQADAEHLTCSFNGRRVFVIGDVHGCVAELNTLVDFIEREKDLGAGDALIFIGDYIDRGPASKEVIQCLLSLKSRLKSDNYFLKGNHEEMLLDWLFEEGSESASSYLHNGGRECLESYGLKSDPRPEDALTQIPKSHMQFFEQLTRYIVSEKFVFVHAGLNALRPLSHQIDDDIFWIRNEFISNIHSFRKIIIYGHTPFEQVKFHLPYKIGIDTGLVYGSKLTAIELSEGELYQIEYGKSEVKVASFVEEGIDWPLP